MFYVSQPREGLCGLVVEGGHPGLGDDNQRRLRRRSDAAWAERFRREPLTQVFADWYQQPVFASLDAAQRASLVALRSRNNGGVGGDAAGQLAGGTTRSPHVVTGARFPFSLPLRRTRRQVSRHRE